MTPRINGRESESEMPWFSSQLFSQLEDKELGHNLTGEGALFHFLHPALMKANYLFVNDRESLNLPDKIFGWTIKTFKNQLEAEASFPKVSSFGGFPKDISLFLAQNVDEAILHFGDLGSAYLTKCQPQHTISKDLELHDYLISVWLNYALSPELWGPTGKWTRFHERLHTLFAHYGLLIGDDFPGYYRLKTEASWLIEEGFLGKKTESDFQLILTWDFPLSGLIKIEKVLARER